jgi:hypothetical protein
METFIDRVEHSSSGSNSNSGDEKQGGKASKKRKFQEYLGFQATNNNSQNDYLYRVPAYTAKRRQVSDTKSFY